jgi:hypothetical protein
MIIPHYQILTINQAAKEGLVRDAEATFNWNTFSCVVLRKTDGTSEIVGWDGGEPEDQLLIRNWKWVEGALNRAFELGQLTAKSEQSR